MSFPDLMTVDHRYIIYGVCIIVFLGTLAWPSRRRKRPTCDLTPLEIRAIDTVDALDELAEVIDKLAEEKRTLPAEVTSKWVKARTSASYLRRFLQEGR